MSFGGRRWRVGGRGGDFLVEGGEMVLLKGRGRKRIKKGSRSGCRGVLTGRTALYWTFV
jgi:hypothetical protein